MKEINKQFKSLKKSKNSNQINDFLISLGKNPDGQYLKYIDFFFDNLDIRILNQVELNLIYLIGEIGKIINIEHKYFDYLIREYFNSDRWMRNEILQALHKIAKQNEMSESIFEILRYALVDDYLPINVNALKLVYIYDTIPKDLYKNIFKLLQTSEAELIEHLKKIFQKFGKDCSQLFDLLNESDNYKSFTKKSIRTLLNIFFQSALNLEEMTRFKSLISHSQWDSQYKQIFLYELEIYEKLLLKAI